MFVARQKSKNPTRLSIILLLGFLFLASSPLSFALETVLPNGEILSLYGIGIHQEKRNDIYLGAVFAASDIKTISQIVSEKNNKRMSFKFLSKYSNRKMSRLLKQRIAMNNSKQQWRPYTKEIVQFADIFKRSLQSGDEINIDYVADKGTQIYLNNTLFLSVEKLGFYKILLNIWFGSIPPSESFKTGINGNNTNYLNDELIAKYNSLQPEAGRFDADKIDASTSTKNKVAKASTKTSSSNKTTKKTAKKTTKKKVTTNKTRKVKQATNKKKASLAIETKKSDSTVSSLTPTLVAVSTPDIVLDSLTTAPILEKREGKETPQETVVQNITSTQKSTVEDSNKGNQQTKSKELETGSPPNSEKLSSDNQPAKNDNALQENEQEQNEVKSDMVAKAESSELLDLDLISGSYTQELISIVRAKQIYPKKALRDGIEGYLVVKITIGNDGQIIEQQILKRSGSRVLDRGVLKMIRRIAPFPNIPVELSVEEFELELPLSFQFSD